MTDRRDRNHKWYSSFDERRMVFIVEEALEDGGDAEIPAIYEVCETCDGKGSHVNPGIDAHGLSREDFDEDPDFAEDYFGGVYDIPCNECGGRRVAPVVAPNAPQHLQDLANDMIDDLREMEAAYAAERRMGA